MALSGILQFSEKFHDHHPVSAFKGISEIQREGIMTHIKYLRTQRLITVFSIAQVRTGIVKI